MIEEETGCWRKEFFALECPTLLEKNGLNRNYQRLFPQGVSICSLIKKRIYKIMHDGTDSCQCSRCRLMLPG